MKKILLSLLFISICNADVNNKIFSQESMSKIGNIKLSSLSSGLNKEKKAYEQASYFFRDDTSNKASESENKMRDIILNKLKDYKKENLQIVKIMAMPTLAITLISYQDKEKSISLTVMACPRYNYLIHGIIYCELENK